MGWKKRRRRRNGGGGGEGGGGGGGKRSLGSTGVKSRHQTQAALPPSFDPSPPLIQTTLPHFPLCPYPPPATSSTFHAALLRALSKPPPRFYLRFLLAARAARGGGWLDGWVGGQPPPARRSALTHAPQPRVRRHLRWCAASEDGFTTVLRRINSAGRFVEMSSLFLTR